MCLYQGFIHPTAWNRNSAKFAKITHLGYALRSPRQYDQFIVKPCAPHPLRGTARLFSCSAPPPSPKPSSTAVLRWAHNTRRYEHPLADGPGRSGWGDTDFHAARTSANQSSRTLDSLYPAESVDSCSSTILRPSIISKVKRTMPLSLPLCSM